LLKDPAGSVAPLSTKRRAQLTKSDFRDAIQNASVRDALSARNWQEVLNNSEGEAELNSQLNANLSAERSIGSQDAARSAGARAA
jgi:hypothetical protein